MSLASSKSVFKTHLIKVNGINNNVFNEKNTVGNLTNKMYMDENEDVNSRFAFCVSSSFVLFGK